MAQVDTLMLVNQPRQVNQPQHLVQICVPCQHTIQDTWEVPICRKCAPDPIPSTCHEKTDLRPVRGGLRLGQTCSKTRVLRVLRSFALLTTFSCAQARAEDRIVLLSSSTPQTTCQVQSLAQNRPRSFHRHTNFGATVTPVLIMRKRHPASPRLIQCPHATKHATKHNRVRLSAHKTHECG